MQQEVVGCCTGAQKTGVREAALAGLLQHLFCFASQCNILCCCFVHHVAQLAELLPYTVD